MLDIRFIREHATQVRRGAQRKGFGQVDIDRLLQVDADLRRAKQGLQEIATRKNKAGEQISKLSGQEKQEAIEEISQLKAQEKEYRERLDEFEPIYEELMLQVPQVPAAEVPDGADDTENVEIRRWGQLPEFDFEPSDHVQLGKNLDIIDIERGVKLAGSRSYFLKGDGALLELAVLRFALDYMVNECGFVAMIPPVLVRDEAMVGTAWFPGGEDQAYRMDRDQLNLAGTAEVPLTAYHSGEILAEEDLPLRYVAWSPCYRREAGTYGKDTHGLYRIHQFQKIEQVIVCKNDEQESIEHHQRILANSEAVVQALELPYRVVNVCAGDLGRGQVQKFDIECWMPSRKNYGETHSASRYHEFQARRLNLRYRGSDKKTRFCHTLNNTVIASPRILISILECNQNADGSVTIPQVLRPYMNGRERIEIKK
ncbi:Serine--tRNA ligase [subsurface metagenome]